MIGDELKMNYDELRQKDTITERQKDNKTKIRKDIKKDSEGFY